MEPADEARDLSVVIITLNEATRLGACLQSLPRGSEVIVLDSGSTDATVEVARNAGAKVSVRKFTNYAEQKNAAITLAERSWVLSLDADEVLSPSLRQEILRVTQTSGGSVAGYRLRRRLVFMGRTLRYGKSSDEPLRLFQKDRGRFHAEIHEKLKLEGGLVGRLAGEILHYSYDDLSDYFRRFNLYTTKIAENHARLNNPMPALPLHLLRPWAEFFSRYFLRLGCLDGYPGYTYALLSSFYTFVKYAKLKELRDRQLFEGEGAS